MQFFSQTCWKFEASFSLVGQTFEFSIWSSRGRSCALLPRRCRNRLCGTFSRTPRASKPLFSVLNRLRGFCDYYIWTSPRAIRCFERQNYFSRILFPQNFLSNETFNCQMNNSTMFVTGDCIESMHRSSSSFRGFSTGVLQRTVTSEVTIQLMFTTNSTLISGITSCPFSFHTKSLAFKLTTG